MSHGETVSKCRICMCHIEDVEEDQGLEVELGCQSPTCRCGESQLICKMETEGQPIQSYSRQPGQVSVVEIHGATGFT